MDDLIKDQPFKMQKNKTVQSQLKIDLIFKSFYYYLPKYLISINFIINLQIIIFLMGIKQSDLSNLEE